MSIFKALPLKISEAPHGKLLPNPEEMAAIDAASLSASVSLLDLMEMAGSAAARQMYLRFGPLYGPAFPILVLCGPGNNGGDGLVLARRMIADGAAVTTVVVEAARYSEGMTGQMKRYLAAGEAFYLFSEEEGGARKNNVIGKEALERLIAGARVVVDGLLGTGQREAPRGTVRRALDIVCAARNRTGTEPLLVALDLPSGINAATGETFEPHAAADLTITFEMAKCGMLQYPAREACGEIVVAPIGLKVDRPVEIALLTRAEKALEPVRRGADAHKGSFGRVLVVGGSAAMPGAGWLAAKAALRTGAGLVYKCEIDGWSNAAAFCPEVILLPVFRSDADWLSKLLEQAGKADSLVLGPGLGQSRESKELVLTLLKITQKEKWPLVLDADALTILGQALSAGEQFDLSSVILSPHPGEMAQLLSTTVREVQQNRYMSAKKLHESTGAVVILKGAASIVYGAMGGFVNQTGNPYMATAGSGDVLAGMLAGFLAQGKSFTEAALCGVHYHGYAGDLAHELTGSTIIASDIIECIPRALAAMSQRAAAAEPVTARPGSDANTLQEG